MEVKINSKLLDRKRFLIAALANKNITQQQYNSEMPEIERKMEQNVRELIRKEEEKLKSDIKKAKEVITDDGDFKRSIAKLIIYYLKDELTESDIKGVFRQGYKIMRAK